MRLLNIFSRSNCLIFPATILVLKFPTRFSFIRNVFRKGIKDRLTCIWIPNRHRFLAVSSRSSSSHCSFAFVWIRSNCKEFNLTNFKDTLLTGFDNAELSIECAVFKLDFISIKQHNEHMRSVCKTRKLLYLFPWDFLAMNLETNN
jgi:hypothetical protein